MKPSRDEADYCSFVGQGMSGDVPAQREAWANNHATWVMSKGKFVWDGDELIYNPKGHAEPQMPMPPGPKVKQRAPRIDVMKLVWKHMETVKC